MWHSGPKLVSIFLKCDDYKISTNLLLSGTHILGQTKLDLPGRNHQGLAIINR